MHILSGFCIIVHLDPTESFQKQIQQIIHKCNTVTDENQQKHLIQKNLWHQNVMTWSKNKWTIVQNPLRMCKILECYVAVYTNS